jgi:hypothetical protein
MHGYLQTSQMQLPCVHSFTRFGRSFEFEKRLPMLKEVGAQDMCHPCFVLPPTCGHTQIHLSNPHGDATRGKTVLKENPCKTWTFDCMDIATNCPPKDGPSKESKNIAFVAGSRGADRSKGTSKTQTSNKHGPNTA